MVTFHPTEMVHVAKNENLKAGLFECSSIKGREHFEVVSGVLNQHELVKVSKSKDAVVNVKKWIKIPRQPRRYLPLVTDL
jgi:hypothetical protein